ENDRAPLSARQSNDRAAPDFTARPRRRRNTNAARQTAPIVIEIEFAQLEFGTLYQQTARLPDIQRAASAESHHRIATGLPKDLGRIDHVLLNRIGMDPVKHLPGF